MGWSKEHMTRKRHRGFRGAVNFLGWAVVVVVVVVVVVWVFPL